MSTRNLLMLIPEELGVQVRLDAELVDAHLHDRLGCDDRLLKRVADCGRRIWHFFHFDIVLRLPPLVF